MQKILVSLLFSSLVFFGFSQSDVKLKINHKLGVEDFALETVGMNNLGQQFKATRLEYYVTRITIIHDSGMETVVSDDIMALVRPEDEIATTIDLGSYDVTTIEKVKFHVGVYSPVNNEDPAVWPMTHPLGPKSPSMHWGWASGYRFIAYEGNCGDGFTQSFQLHGLGNSNYFEVESDVDVTDEGGTLVMELNGNYSEGLRDIIITGGTISHGETGEAKKVLENWRDIVFGLYYVGLEEEANLIDWSVFPNPSNGQVQVNFGDISSIKEINLLNPLGEIVQTKLVNNTQNTLSINDAGVYFVSVIAQNGETIANKRLIIK